MTLKVVFDAAGAVVGYGPDTDEYQPIIPAGGHIERSQAQPGFQPTAQEVLGAHRGLARAELDASDRTAIRCVKAGVPYPQAWRDRDVVLRAIVALSSGVPSEHPIPDRPPYPAGT